MCWFRHLDRLVNQTYIQYSQGVQHRDYRFVRCSNITLKRYRHTLFLLYWSYERERGDSLILPLLLPTLKLRWNGTKVVCKYKVKSIGFTQVLHGSLLRSQYINNRDYCWNKDLENMFFWRWLRIEKKRYIKEILLIFNKMRT